MSTSGQPTSGQPTAAKKRIMFIKGEDFNYLAYNVLIALDELGCNSPSHRFRDHRKLAFLIDLIASPTLTSMLLRQHRLKSPLSQRDALSLATAYANGASRRHLVERVTHSLVSRGLLALRRNDKGHGLDVWLTPDTAPAFFKSDLYKLERENLGRLISFESRLRTLKLGTFLQRCFDDQGVQTWHF